MNARTMALWVAALCISAGTSQGQKIKVIVDQDARGPATTDMQSILIFLQSDKFDVLGITTVSGDQWVKEETQRTLRLLEIAGRTDVPVIAGAEFPHCSIPKKKLSGGKNLRRASLQRLLERFLEAARGHPACVPCRLSRTRTSCLHWWRASHTSRHSMTMPRISS